MAVTEGRDVPLKFVARGIMTSAALSTMFALDAQELVAGCAADGPLLYAREGLSFWGGVDQWTGEVIDHTHPLHGRYSHPMWLSAYSHSLWLTLMLGSLLT